MMQGALRRSVVAEAVRPSFALTRHYAAASNSESLRKVTLIPGDGIGVEISNAVKQIFAAARTPIEWEEVIVSTVNAKPGQNPLNQDVIDSINRNKIGLKGPLATPIGKGHMSLNLALRKQFGLYANVRPVKSIPGVKSGYDDINLCVIRENTEGEYTGIEHKVVEGVAQSIKLITREASKKVGDYAFQYAKFQGKKKVTCAHKVSVMRLADGLFLKSVREVSASYPMIQFEDMSIDKVCMQLTDRPHNFDVLVLPNLYGDIVSDLCAGLIGGLGLTPSGNIGTEAAIFESVHGTAPDIAGQNKANPTALLLSAVMMLRHMHLFKKADVIEQAALDVLREGKTITGDLGGKASTSEYTDAICKRIGQIGNL